jgi:hypothetical protein
VPSGLRPLEQVATPYPVEVSASLRAERERLARALAGGGIS